MLFPIKHENLTARRWPVVTLGLIALNVVVFLCTHGAMERQDDSLWDVESHLLFLSAQHPELNHASEAGQFIADFQKMNPQIWASLQDTNHTATDDWFAWMQGLNDPGQLQAEMDSLGADYAGLKAASISQRYAFIPAHPRPIAYLTSQFLHAGWWHLIGNMWFLWLAGFVLEDVWGRPLYLAFYLAAGVTAMQLDAWANPLSIGTTLGASGAIAGLMGAFLVRFPKLKIRLVWLFDPFVLGGFWRLWVRAYWLLPLWVGMEMYYSKIFGQGDGIGHSAHIGGFIFGTLAALALRRSGLEHTANKAIEEKVSWTADPEINRASELVSNSKFDEAAPILQNYLSTKPDSFAALNLLHIVHWRRSEVQACREVISKLCRLNLHARMYEAAWQNYEEFLNMGGEEMPPAIWLQLCRVREEQNDFERALSEYEKLAAAYPAERHGLMAQLGAARISLKQLNRPHEALKWYEAASASSVPHLDLEPEIALGIWEAKTTAPMVT